MKNLILTVFLIVFCFYDIYSQTNPRIIYNTAATATVQQVSSVNSIPEIAEPGTYWRVDEWDAEVTISDTIPRGFSNDGRFVRSNGSSGNFIVLQRGEVGYSGKALGLIADYDTTTQIATTDIGPILQDIFEKAPERDVPIFLADGDYYASGNNQIDSSTQKMSIIGQEGSTIYVEQGNVWYFYDYNDNLTFKNLTFKPADGNAIDSEIIRLHGTDNVFFENIDVYGSALISTRSSSTYGDIAENIYFDNVRIFAEIDSNQTQTDEDLLLFQFANNIVIRDCYFKQGLQDAVKMNIGCEHCGDIRIYNTTFDGQSDDCFDSYGGGSGLISFEGCTFNGCGVNIKSQSRTLAQHATVENCSFYDGARIKVDGQNYSPLDFGDAFMIVGNGTDSLYQITHKYGYPSTFFQESKAFRRGGVEVSGIEVANIDNTNLYVDTDGILALNDTIYFILNPYEGESVSSNRQFTIAPSGQDTLLLVENSDWLTSAIQINIRNISNFNSVDTGFVYEWIGAFTDSLVIRFDNPLTDSLLVVAQTDNIGPNLVIERNKFFDSKPLVAVGTLNFEFNKNLVTLSDDSTFISGQTNHMLLPISRGVSKIDDNKFIFPQGINDTDLLLAISGPSTDPKRGVDDPAGKLIVSNNYFLNVRRAFSPKALTIGRGQDYEFFDNTVVNGEDGVNNQGFSFTDEVIKSTSDAGLTRYRRNRGNVFIDQKQDTFYRSKQAEFFPDFLTQDFTATFENTPLVDLFDMFKMEPSSGNISFGNITPSGQTSKISITTPNDNENLVEIGRSTNGTSFTNNRRVTINSRGRISQECSETASPGYNLTQSSLGDGVMSNARTGFELLIGGASISGGDEEWSAMEIGGSIIRTGDVSGNTNSFKINHAVSSAANYNAIYIANNFVGGKGIYQSGADMENVFLGQVKAPLVMIDSIYSVVGQQTIYPTAHNHYNVQVVTAEDTVFINTNNLEDGEQFSMKITNAFINPVNIYSSDGMVISSTSSQNNVRFFSGHHDLVFTWDSDNTEFNVAGGYNYDLIEQPAKINTDDGDDMISGLEYPANTSGGAFTLDLPASPHDKARVAVWDSNGTFDTNNLTIGRNGQTINGISSDYVISIEGAYVEFVYSASVGTWKRK